MHLTLSGISVALLLSTERCDVTEDRKVGICAANAALNHKSETTSDEKQREKEGGGRRLQGGNTPEERETCTTLTPENFQKIAGDDDEITNQDE